MDVMDTLCTELVTQKLGLRFLTHGIVRVYHVNHDMYPTARASMHSVAILIEHYYSIVTQDARFSEWETLTNTIPL